MNTKVIYCLTSSENDIYLEQMWVSITSLKMHNPNANISVLLDEATKSSLSGYRAKVLKLVDELIVVKTPSEYSPKEKSRYLKTTVRQLVKGSFLFLDTDTVIAGDISEIDNIPGDILLCPEYHDTFDKYPNRASIIKKVKYIFSTDISNDSYYFNSGVILCRDTEMAHDFYRKWHDNWTFSAKQKNVSFDQPALAKTNHDLGQIIQLLDGTYHCQFYVSMKYFCDAKIIHFFNEKWFKLSKMSPFIGEELYLGIKEEQSINSDVLEKILTVKSQFPTVSVVVGEDEMMFLMQNGEPLIKSLSDNKTLLMSLFGWIIKILVTLYWYLSNSRFSFLVRK